MTSNQTRILLIEDHAGYRETIELALDQEADMTPIGSFGSAEVALRDLQDETTHHPSPAACRREPIRQIHHRAS